MPGAVPRSLKVCSAFPALLLIAVSAGAPRLEAQATGTVRGRVVDGASGRGLEAAQLTLLPDARSVLSDVDGSFVFARVPAGAHTLRVLRLGYAPWEGEITVPREGESESVAPLAVALTPRAEQLAGITEIGRAHV